MFILNIMLFGCSYSFTGASVPPHLQTIAIPLFDDRSGSGQPELSENFTNELLRKFIEDNTFRITDKTNADALLECTITGLTDTPVVIAGGDQVQTRRINLTVKVFYKDLVEKKTVFDKNFSNHGDYSSEGDIVELRNSAILTAVDKITEDILFGVVANW